MHELDRLRAIVRELPEVTERLSHGEPCFFIRNNRALCYFHDRHNDDRLALWCPAPPGAADELAYAEPGRFFKPRPSARGTFSSWLGIYLDVTDEAEVDWTEISEILEDAYRTVAPKQLVATLDRRWLAPERRPLPGRPTSSRDRRLDDGP